MANDIKDALDNFLTPTLARQFDAEQALINGEPRPRLALTSTQDPVTEFGAKVPLRRRWDEVSGTLCWLASRWSKGTHYRFELVAAGVSEDLAYVVGFEHITKLGQQRPSRAVHPARHPHLPPRKTTIGRLPTATQTTCQSIRPFTAKLEHSTASMPSVSHG